MYIIFELLGDITQVYNKIHSRGILFHILQIPLSDNFRQMDCCVRQAEVLQSALLFEPKLQEMQASCLYLRASIHGLP